jgi:hypothetical protein
MIHLVCRNGFEVGGVHKVGEPLELLEEHPVGIVPDTLRRVLELPTAPPAVPIDEWLALLWLSRVVGAARRGKRQPKLSWEEAAALHPLTDLAEAECGVELTPNQLVVDGPRMASRLDWDRMRAVYARDGDERAAWMDAGMFARWMIGSYPPMSVLLGRAARRLTKQAAADVSAALSGWGLLAAASVA